MWFVGALLHFIGPLSLLASTISPFNLRTENLPLYPQISHTTLQRRASTHWSCSPQQATFVQDLLVQVALFADCARRGLRAHTQDTERELHRIFQGHRRGQLNHWTRSVIDTRYRYIIEETIERRGRGFIMIVCNHQLSLACTTTPYLLIDTNARENKLTLVLPQP